MKARKCLVKNCNREYRAKGYCAMHYSRLHRGHELGGLDAQNHRHGLEKHPLYHTWEAMRQRCNDPKASNYKWYGARGVKICKRWNDFRLFLEDVGDKPEKMTLDRIDVNGNYEPGNVRWATHHEQRINQRKMVKNATV